MTLTSAARAAAIDGIDQQSLARLADWLRRARQQVLHGAGCACCGRGPVRFDQSMMDADLLGYLSSQYRAAGEAALLATVEAWIADPGPGLVARLGGAPVDAGLRARILRDVLEVLESSGGRELEPEGQS